MVYVLNVHIKLDESSHPGESGDYGPAFAAFVGPVAVLQGVIPILSMTARDEGFFGDRQIDQIFLICSVCMVVFGILWCMGIAGFLLGEIKFDGELGWECSRCFGLCYVVSGIAPLVMIAVAGIKTLQSGTSCCIDQTWVFVASYVSGTLYLVGVMLLTFCVDCTKIEIIPLCCIPSERVLDRVIRDSSALENSDEQGDDSSLFSFGESATELAS